MSKKSDSFAERRLEKFVGEFRRAQAKLPTLKDILEAGFDEALIKTAIKSGRIEELYVTLTTGAVVKAFRRRDPTP